MNFLHTTAPEILVLDSRLNHSRFLSSDLSRSVFRECDLSHTEFEQCNLAGATIDGVAVTELLECWKQQQAEKAERVTRPRKPPAPGSLFPPADGENA
jgi:hypothetical protein